MVSALVCPPPKNDQMSTNRELGLTKLSLQLHLLNQDGEMTGGVDITTPYLTVHLLSVILTGINRAVVVVVRMEGVVILQNIVLVSTVLTMHVYTETGKNQEVHRSGDMTGGVDITTPYLTVHLLSVILTGINRAVVVVVRMEGVVILQNIVLVSTVLTMHVYTETGKNQEVHRSGDMTGGVVDTSPYLTIHLLNVSLTGINRVAVVFGLESVAILQNIVCVVPVQTTHVYTETGKNQEVHRSGDMTGGVVDTSPYLTVHLFSVILTGINPAAMMIGMETVVARLNIVLVHTVRTTHRFLKIGENQEVHRSGEMMVSVVDTTPYQTVQLLNVILTGINRVVVVCGMDGVATR